MTCTGYSMEDDETTAMTVKLYVDGTLLVGQGYDVSGLFSIRGDIGGNTSDRDAVSFRMAFKTRTVAFDGTVSADGTTLTGRWTLPDATPTRAGSFRLVVEPEGSAVVVEETVWAGHYVQHGRQHATGLSLSVYSTGRIDARGDDSVGSFTISGRFLEYDERKGDATTFNGKFVFLKQYARHAIAYEGVRDGDVMTGTYSSSGTAYGAFVLERQGSDNADGSSSSA